MKTNLATSLETAITHPALNEVMKRFMELGMTQEIFVALMCAPGVAEQFWSGNASIAIIRDKNSDDMRCYCLWKSK